MQNKIFKQHFINNDDLAKEMEKMSAEEKQLYLKNKFGCDVSIAHIEKVFKNRDKKLQLVSENRKNFIKEQVQHLLNGFTDKPYSHEKSKRHFKRQQKSVAINGLQHHSDTTQSDNKVLDVKNIIAKKSSHSDELNAEWE